MKKLAKINRVEVSGDHVLSVWFEDGSSGVWRPQICSRTGPMAIPLHDPAFFARVCIEDGALVWPNGWDASADYVFKEMERLSVSASSAIAAE